VASHSPDVTLQGLLSQPGCSASCWDGIEAEITTYDELIDLLDESNVAFTKSVILDAETYHWKLSPDHPLSRPEEPAIVAVAASPSEGIVGFVHVGNINLCVSTVIREYGIPDTLVESSPTTYVLQYPDSHLIFTADNDLRRVYNFYIRSPEVIKTSFGIYPLIEDQAEIESLVAGDCTDAFTSTQ
jgi:hypothetical protein